jgi:hypothetical protein
MERPDLDRQRNRASGLAAPLQRGVEIRCLDEQAPAEVLFALA